MWKRSPKKEEQFLKAYDSYADNIFRHCYFRMSNRERAKELMQETFVKAWIYMSRGGEVKNIKAFLYKIANNLIVDEYRRKKELALEEMQHRQIAMSESWHEKVHSKIEAESALKILNSISAKYQKIVLMRLVDDLSIKEIASILGKTENNISVRLHRALKQMRKILNYEQTI
ncbi:RNA polymerase sigma factor [Candidatus Peregrinibacteria bacterium]|nr:RNA polymerase sigma factor [Candidatus Peregrinibacteria bacterium]